MSLYFIFFPRPSFVHQPTAGPISIVIGLISSIHPFPWIHAFRLLDIILHFYFLIWNYLMSFHWLYSPVCVRYTAQSNWNSCGSYACEYFWSIFIGPWKRIKARTIELHALLTTHVKESSELKRLMSGFSHFPVLPLEIKSFDDVRREWRTLSLSRSSEAIKSWPFGLIWFASIWFFFLFFLWIVPDLASRWSELSDRATDSRSDHFVRDAFHTPHSRYDFFMYLWRDIIKEKPKDWRGIFKIELREKENRSCVALAWQL